MDETQETNVSSQKKVNPMLMVGVVAVLILGVGLWLGSRNFTGKNISSSQVSNGNVGNQRVVADVSNDTEEEINNIKTIKIEAGSYYYNPDEIKVRVGEKVRIILTAVDMMHDFNIDELGVKIPVTPAGETSEVEFTVDEPGEYEYYCSVGQHRALGQVGTLIVEEKQ